MSTQVLKTLVFGMTALVLLTMPALAADKPPIKIGLLYSLSGMAAVVTKAPLLAMKLPLRR